MFNDFGVNYSGKEHVLHQKASLEDKYKVTIYWEGKSYIGMALKWDYEKCMVQLSISVYVCAALHYFKQQNPEYHRIHYTPRQNLFMEIE